MSTFDDISEFHLEIQRLTSSYNYIKDTANFRKFINNKVHLPSYFWNTGLFSCYDIAIENGYSIPKDIDSKIFENYVLNHRNVGLQDDIFDEVLRTGLFTKSLTFKLFSVHSRISESNFIKLLNADLLCEESISRSWREEHHAVILARYGYVPPLNVIQSIPYNNYRKSHIKLFHSACADFSSLGPNHFSSDGIALIAKYCNVNEIDSFGNGFLHYTNNEKAWRRLVARGANVNLRNNKGYTPLIVILQNNQSPEVPLRYNLDLTLLYDGYQNCLFYGPLKFLPLLYEAGAISQTSLSTKRKNKGLK